MLQIVKSQMIKHTVGAELIQNLGGHNSCYNPIRIYAFSTFLWQWNPLQQLESMWSLMQGWVIFKIDRNMIF